MKHRACLVALFTIFTVFSHSAVGIQKWVDEAGNAHYGDRPPVGGTSEQVRVDSAPSGSGNSSSVRSLSSNNISSRSSKSSSSNLRPEEMKRLREIEAQDRKDEYYARVDDRAEVRDKYYEERSKRNDTRSRCSELDRMYVSGSYSKGDIITQKRNLGC